MTTTAVLTSFCFLGRHYGDIQSSNYIYILSASNPGLPSLLTSLLRVMQPKANLPLPEILPSCRRLKNLTCTMGDSKYIPGRLWWALTPEDTILLGKKSLHSPPVRAWRSVLQVLLVLCSLHQHPPCTAPTPRNPKQTCNLDPKLFYIVMQTQLQQ